MFCSLCGAVQHGCNVRLLGEEPGKGCLGVGTETRHKFGIVAHRAVTEPLCHSLAAVD